MTNYEMVYHDNSSALTVQGKDSSMNAPLNSALAAQSSSQMTVDESWMKRIWEWADEFEIPENNIPRNRDGLLAITRLAIFRPHWESPKISYLPDELTFLSNIAVLKINRCALTSLPESIGKLYHLRELDVSDNRLSELPESIGQLTNLLKLNADFNSLSVVVN